MLPEWVNPDDVPPEHISGFKIRNRPCVSDEQHGCMKSRFVSMRLSKRTIADGREQWQYYCTKCGRGMSHSVRKLAHLNPPQDEEVISIAAAEKPWGFDGDAAAFQLACEAKRIDLAFLFDPMMAVHTSNVDPLPHQITAVYESLLPRQPLRYVLADDPGSGKTIMAGLYIRELIMRADARRILIVAPGGLVDQWREELFEKFGLEFNVFAGTSDEASGSNNPFEDHNQLIVRLDQMSRDEELSPSEERQPGPLQSKLLNAGWDLVVFDEAHKLAAHFYGNQLQKTGRFRFAERLGAETRHLLLMTATPHNGKEEDFQLFLSLLDSDRFYGKFRDGVHKVDATDLMRRMVKEELVKFDGTPLFPERKAYTVNYTLSDLEAALYEAVTQYVRTEMGKADELDGKRKGSVGFALTSLQRRLASSPAARSRRVAAAVPPVLGTPAGCVGDRDSTRQASPTASLSAPSRPGLSGRALARARRRLLWLRCARRLGRVLLVRPSAWASSPIAVLVLPSFR